MKEVDKNDVDISQLFKWRKEVAIQDAYTGLEAKVYLRLVGDADLNRAKVYGYRKAAVLRKALRTEDSDERVSYLANIEDYTDREVLVQTIIILEIPEAHQEAINKVILAEPKEPGSKSGQEKWEEYQEKIDMYPKNYAEAIEKEMANFRNIEYEKLSGKSIEELYKLYESIVINRLCEEELNNAFYSMCVFLGTFLDPQYKKKVFTTIEEFENAHRELKTRLRDEYKTLEIGADLLKKSLEATG